MSVRSKLTTSRVAAVVGIGVAAVALVAGGAVAGGQIGSPDIKDGGVYSPDLHDGGVRSVDIRDGAIHGNDVADGLKSGRLRGLESDGPYPGATNLGDIEGNQGSNSTKQVQPTGEIETVWVKCPDGKTALSGGFALAADAGSAAAKAVQVVASYPTGDAIEGDAAGSIMPDGWAVDAINTGEAPRIVRPWVVCAKVTG